MADLITYGTKSNYQTASDVPTDQKVSAADLNEIKTVVNTNSAETDTNAGNITAISTSLTPGTSNSTVIDLTSRAGTTHSNSGAFMSDTTFTLAGSPVDLGFAFILSNAGSVPTITGATAHANFATDYATGADNIILVSYINGAAYYQLAFK